MYTVHKMVHFHKICTSNFMKIAHFIYNSIQNLYCILPCGAMHATNTIISQSIK